MTSPYNGNGCGYDGCGYGIGVPMPSTAVPLLLDDLAVTYGAWSVGRKLRSGFGNYGLLMRRSTDNDVTECTFDSNGLSDVGLVEDFSSGGDVFIDTLLNQDANGSTLDLIQATTTVQPIVCESGVAVTKGGLLAAKFASGRRMTVPASTAMFKFLHNGTKFCATIVHQPNNTAAEKMLFATRYSEPGFQASIDSTEKLRVAISTQAVWVSLVTFTNIATSLDILSLLVDASNATAASRVVAYRNGTQYSGSNASTGSPTTANAGNSFTLGGVEPSATTAYDGTISELIIWPTDERADRSIWEADQASAYGITLA